MSVRTLQLSIIAAALAVVVTGGSAAGTKPPFNQNSRGLALHGYDPVAYFDAQRPVKGHAQFEHRWNGATWRFASPESRAKFAAAPETYAPQFGGYCAWAVSRGYTADIDPDAWRIVDGRLYLNYSRSVQRTWERDIPGNIARARDNWPAVLQ
jgi:YHS domain-containing protein